MSQEYMLQTDIYSGREAVFALVAHTLSQAQSGLLQLVSVRGSSGVGKTSFLSSLAVSLCPSLQWQPVRINFAPGRPDASIVLSAVESALVSLVEPSQLAHYRMEKEEIERHYRKNRVELISKRQLPFSPATPVLSNDEIGLLLQSEQQRMRTGLSRALCKLASSCSVPLCVLIDDYDHLLETENELVGWLWEDLLDALAASIAQPLVVVVCGKQWASEQACKHIEEERIAVQEVELNNLDLFQVKNYLIRKFVLIADASLAEQGELISFFYELTQGHPLSLELAVIYFKTFQHEERNARTLRVHLARPAERASIKTWLELLLSRLPEPHRTLLECGPVARILQEETLQVLLHASKNDAGQALTLSEQVYQQFLLYPFFMQAGGSELYGEQPFFHTLLRRVQLQVLRYQHPQLYERLQRAMMSYYESKLVAYDHETQPPAPPPPRVRRRDRLKRWLRHEVPLVEKPVALVLNLEEKVEVPTSIFEATLEYLYHALQLQDLQAEAFLQWKVLLERVIASGQRQRIGQLWEVVRQLSAEDETFLSRPGEGPLINQPYAQYHKLYNEYIEHDMRTFARR